MRDRIFMGAAKRFAQLSKDPKTKVGCVVVCGDEFLVVNGCNGTPPGSSNQMRDDNGDTMPDVLHAEANAIGKAAKWGLALNLSTMYTTRAPCLSCAKLIFQAGIREVVYLTDHSCNSGIHFLRRHGCTVRKLNE